MEAARFDLAEVREQRREHLIGAPVGADFRARFEHERVLEKIARGGPREARLRGDFGDTCREADLVALERVKRNARIV